MTRSESERIQDILLAISAIEKATKFLEGDDHKPELEQIVLDAITFQLLVIGEAVKSLGDEFLRGHPDIPWRQIARLRDRIGHHYFGLNSAELWSIVEKHLAGLRVALENQRD